MHERSSRKRFHEFPDHRFLHRFQLHVFVGNYRRYSIPLHWAVVFSQLVWATHRHQKACFHFVSGGTSSEKWAVKIRKSYGNMRLKTMLIHEVKIHPYWEQQNACTFISVSLNNKNCELCIDKILTRYNDSADAAYIQDEICLEKWLFAPAICSNIDYEFGSSPRKYAFIKI